MEIKVKLTPEIVNQSLRLHYASAPAKQRYSILFIPVAMWVVSIYFFVSDLKNHVFATNSYMGICYVVLGFAYFFYMRHRRVNTGKQLIKLLGANSSFDMDVDDYQLVTNLPTGTINHDWETFHKAIISRDIVLLYQPNLSFTMFHHSFFNDRDFETFKKMVSDHIVAVKEV